MPALLKRNERIRAFLVSNRRHRAVPGIDDGHIRHREELFVNAGAQLFEAAAGQVGAANAATKEHVAAEDDW